MLEKNFSLLFYLKKPKNYLKGPMPIYLRVTVDGSSKELSIGKVCEIDRWNSNSGRMYGTKEDAKLVNAYLDTLQNKVYEVRRKMLDKDESITAEAIKNTLRGINQNSKMIMVLFQQHNDQMQSLVNKDYAAGTLERYKISFLHTKSFMEWKYGVSDMDIKKLNYEFISQYEFWLKTVRNCNHNSTVKYLANFRKIVIGCIKRGWLERDPFAGFKMTKKEVIPEFLTEDELENISIKKFASERISQVRDIFLFCCHTGLAFVDVKKLKASEIGIGIDGSKWIFALRQKTGTPSRIPLLPLALEILDKYKDHPVCVNSDKLLPVLCNQKYNEYLKEIANICGINKNLTTHTARHTFATTVTLGNGVPMESVSKMLGHKNLRTTQHYAKVLDKKISEDMNMLKNIMQFKSEEKLKVVGRT